ncbi:MAG: hypothetical protein PVJ09_02040 [Candidatus Woesebacteria bacterium]|jgi:hypothetical protein
MTIIKKLAKYLFCLLILFILLSPLWIKMVPLNYLSSLTGKTSVFDKYLCNYSVQVHGDSMAPIISEGSFIGLDRCFIETELTEGTVVLFGKGSNLHLGIIRHVLHLNPVVYKVSNERPHERLQDIIKEEIVAINKDIDTSASNYQAKQSEESFILDPSEFLSDLYLGKIPKGYGVEMAELEKTTLFFREKDKFCSVIVPKKDLVSVDIEIVDTKTQNAVVSNTAVIFNVRPNPNINCMDFGSGQGMLNLNPGNYRYRFLVNHQVLRDIQFSVE